MNRVIIILFIILCNLLQRLFCQNILHVGPGQTYSNPREAAIAAHPGDTILIHPASYTGSYFIENLKGNAQAWITIKGVNRDQVIFTGGSESMHFIDPEFVIVSNLTITGQTGNGMNIDDGGTYGTPAKHVHIDNCVFHDMNATGNNDMLKLSGVDSFTVSNCRFENGSAGGSGIDMVGCHEGLFIKNEFVNQGSNSIQMKGGTANIHIDRNHFTNGGQRSLNLGGSTGSAFFRPPGVNYEAKDLLVTANIFEGSEAPIAYVSCRNVKVINNTIILPTTWIFRILQESGDTSFYQSCANNVFSNNIVVVNNSLRSDINIGPYTLAQTFTFSNNLWYHLQNSNWNGPQLPSNETAAIIQKNPLFKDFVNKDYGIMNNSPAVGKGKKYNGYVFDYRDNPFLNPPSIGAFEKNMVINNEESEGLVGIESFPNPCKDYIFFKNLPDNLLVTLSDLSGGIILQLTTSGFQKMLYLKNVNTGLYFLNISNLYYQKTWLIQKAE